MQLTLQEHQFNQVKLVVNPNMATAMVSLLLLPHQAQHQDFVGRNIVSAVAQLNVAVRQILAAWLQVTVK